MDKRILSMKESLRYEGVSVALLPTMQLQTSYQRLTDASNPSKNKKLSVYDEFLYERPAKKSQDVKEMLSTMFNEATKSYQTLLNMIEKCEKIKMGTVSFLDRERKIG